MREVLPLLVLKNRVLHIVFEKPLNHPLRRGAVFALKCAGFDAQPIKILGRLYSGLTEIYSVMVCGKDPHNYVESICQDPKNPKKRIRVIIDFLQEDGTSVEQAPKLELHP